MTPTFWEVKITLPIYVKMQNGTSTPIYNNTNQQLITLLDEDPRLPGIQAIKSVLAIPYWYIDPSLIQENFSKSAAQITADWRENQIPLFYMNSCLPRTLLLIDALKQIQQQKNEITEIHLIVDVYSPIRKGSPYAWTPVSHYAIEYTINGKVYSLQFFNKSFHVLPWAYTNPEENFEQLLGPVKVDARSFESDDSIPEILTKNKTAFEKPRAQFTASPVFQALSQQIDNGGTMDITMLYTYMLELTVKRLVDSNTLEEFQKPVNQEFMSKPRIYTK